MKIIEITSFELRYDGMYFISWENHEIRVFLELNTILKMLEIEGLTYKEVNDIISGCKPFKFCKVTMTVIGKENGGKLTLKTSDFSEEYLGNKDLTMIDVELKMDKRHA